MKEKIEEKKRNRSLYELKYFENFCSSYRQKNTSYQYLTNVLRSSN